MTKMDFAMDLPSVNIAHNTLYAKQNKNKSIKSKIMNKEQFLAMSLPHGLKVALTSDIEFYDDDFDDSLTKKGSIWELIGLNNTSDLYISVGSGDGDLSNVLRYGDYWITTDSGFKPILHSLTDLIKPIEHKGEKFVPCEYFTYEVECDLRKGLVDCELPFAVIWQLIKWHFDVAGLIEKGEAIDVNTLPENPYK